MRQAAAASLHHFQPDIKVKPPGSTTPTDVFSTVPLVVAEDCQEVALVCTCMDPVAEEEQEEEGGGSVVPGRLDTVNAGLTRSCMNGQRDTPEFQQPISFQMHFFHHPLAVTKRRPTFVSSELPSASATW